MAGIDKTYVKTWEEYQAMKEWFQEHRYFKTKDDYVVDLGYCLFDWVEKEDFDGVRSIPIMSTSCLEDYILLKNCDVPCFIENMITCYGQEEIDAIRNGTSEYDTFSKEGKYGTKARIIKWPKKCWSGTQNLGIEKPRGQKSWRIDLNVPDEYRYLWYDDDLNRWFWPYEQGEGHSSVAYANSLKAAIRKLRKWKLPKGTIASLEDKYMGDEYQILVY